MKFACFVLILIQNENPFQFRFFDENFYVLNYKFVKVFSKGGSDDWTISHINHVNFSDEVEIQNKTFKEFLKQSMEQKNDKNKKE